MPVGGDTPTQFQRNVTNGPPFPPLMKGPVGGASVLGKPLLLQEPKRYITLYSRNVRFRGSDDVNVPVLFPLYRHRDVTTPPHWPRPRIR